MNLCAQEYAYGGFWSAFILAYLSSDIDGLVADYSTSVRIFEALREKTENKTQYDAYVKELKPVREELGMLPLIDRPVFFFNLADD